MNVHLSKLYTPGLTYPRVLILAQQTCNGLSQDALIKLGQAATVLLSWLFLFYFCAIPSWSEAMTYCKQNHLDLVSVPSPQIERRVMIAARRASTAAMWMSLHHYCSMNMWLWLRGEVVCYQNWAAGNSTGSRICHEQRVVAIQSAGDQRWVSLLPTLRLNFICTNSEP